ERNDPRVVQHLVRDRDLGRRLHDAHRIAVERRQDRARDAARDATVVVREIFHREERPVRLAATTGGLTLPAFFGELGDASVLRVYDVRRVAERARAGLGRVERGKLEAAAVVALAERGEAGDAARRALLELFRSQELSRAELRRALHLNAAHVTARERALQIGIAPRQARHPPI